MSFSHADIQIKMANKGMLHRQMSLRGWKSKSSMKGDPLEKPPPLLLPQKDHARTLQGRALHTRSLAKYDNFSGIVKRVQDMKLSMDTDDSENSSVRTRSSRGSAVPPGFSGEEPGSPFEDESSASDVTGSDHCPPYEEIPNGTASSQYSCSTVSSPGSGSSASGGGAPHFLNSFRDCKPLDHCPVYSNEPGRLSRFNSNSSFSINNNESVELRLSASPAASQYSNAQNAAVTRQRGQRSRPTSVYSNSDAALLQKDCDTVYNNDVGRPRSATVYSNGDVRRPSSLYSNTENVRRSTSLYSNYEPDYGNTQTSHNYVNTDDDSATTDVNKNDTAPAEKADITESEKRKIEMFFRGLRTELWVSKSLANMYISKSGQEGAWTFKHTGVPLLVLESGDTKSRSKRRIQIILAERGTSFPLWKDTIDNLSSYRKSGQAFHTMHLSSDHQQVVGLSFDSSEEADRLLSTIERLTADPENINICVPGAKRKPKTKEKKLQPLPTKKQISAPCLFEHVTSVAAKDQPIYMSLKVLLDRGMKQPENIA